MTTKFCPKKYTMFFISFLLLLSFVLHSNAGCPNARKMAEKSDICGIIYQDEFCGGNSISFKIDSSYRNLKNLLDWDGDVSDESGSNDQASSAQVKPGCLMKIYEHRDFGGRTEDLVYNEYGIIDFKKFDSLNNEVSSLSCICEEWVTCTPNDKLNEIGRCAASKDLKNPVECSYTYETGTVDTETQSAGSSTTTTVSASVGVTLESIFSASTSLSTEWKTWQSSSSTQTFTKSETFTVTVTAEPGETIVIGQRVAACGKYKVSTSYEVFSGKLGNKFSRARRLISNVKVA